MEYSSVNGQQDARRKAFEALEAEKTDELILMNDEADNEMILALRDIEKERK